MAAVNLWFWETGKSGIFNCGTGRAETFRAVADAVVDFHQKGAVEYIEFPEKLKGRYQAYTGRSDQAARRRLRRTVQNGRRRRERVHGTVEPHRIS